MKRRASMLKRRAWKRAWVARHTEKVRRDLHVWLATHPEKVEEYRKRDRIKKAMPEARAKKREKDAAYYRAHPELYRAHNRRRKALLRGAPLSDFSDAQFEEIKAVQKWRCYYCHKRRLLHRDHLTPVTQNGADTLHNIIAVCKSCHSSKGTGRPPVPVQPLLLTLAPAKKVKKKTS